MGRNAKEEGQRGSQTEVVGNGPVQKEKTEKGKGMMILRLWEVLLISLKIVYTMVVTIFLTPNFF